MTAPSQNTWDLPEQSAEETDLMPVAADGPSGPASASAVVPANHPPRKGLSIGVKATALAAIFGVVPVLVVGNVAYRSADSSITERIAQQEIAGVDQLSDQLRRFLQERQANMSTVASIVRDSRLLQGSLSNDEQAEVERILTRELTDFVQAYRTYASITIFDLQGDPLLQSSGSAGELNQRSSTYFQQVLETQQPVISEPVPIDPEGDSNRLAVYVASPVIGESGQIQAVVAGKIPVDFVGNAILRAASADESSVYRLVDSSGEIFQNLPADPESPQIGRPLEEILSRFPDVNTQNQQQAWIESTGGEEFLNAYAPLQGFDQLNWSVVTSTNTSAAFVAQRQLLQTIFLGTVVTGVVAVLLGIWLAKRATLPVEQVAKAVELLGQGQLDARVPVRGRDELAVLGSNVNRMAGQIQALLGTLRQNSEQLGLQNDVLSGLARNEALIQGDAQAASQAFSEAVAATLAVERVSVWLHQPESEAMMCLADYHPQAEVSAKGQRLALQQLPDYFEVVSNNQVLNVQEGQRDAIVQQLAAVDAIAPSTSALLEVPIQIAGSFVGTVRCENPTVREWKAEEQTFVNSVGNLVSLALESEFLQAEVSHLLDVVSEVEDGNLTTQAQVSDRSTGLVADTFNRLIERLADVLQQVINTAQDVSAGANQQKAQADRVALNAEQQAQGVSQVLNLTEQVEAMAEESAHQVEVTNQSLQAVQTSVEQGQAAIAGLTAGIGTLQEGSDRIVQQMKTLGEFVGLADQFVQDQSQIASLTQTLALNASLVAARAAEQRDPRQFVVAAREFNSIATQVSQLAQQTNESLITLEQRSAQIHSVVSTIDAEVQGLGSLVQEFTAGVDQSNQVFGNVQSGTLQAVSIGETIARSSAEIVRAAQSTANVVRDISTIATKSAELTQQSSLQAEQIDRLAAQLLQTIQFFQLPEAAVAETVSPVDLSEAGDALPVAAQDVAAHDVNSNGHL